MKIRICYLAIAVTALFVCASIAPAAPPKKAVKKPKTGASAAHKRVIGRPSNAENGLVGIKLFDSGLRLISVFGSPDDIQAVQIGGSTAGPGGGGAGPGSSGAGPQGPRMGGAPGASPGGPPGGPSGPAGLGFNSVMTDNDPLWFAPPGGPTASGGPPNSGSAAGPAGGTGMPGRGMAPGAGGAPAAGGGAVQSSGRTVYTRWIYKRGGSRYGFILDKFNHVVEIEAVGLSNPKVRTKKGIGFGASFGTVIRKYGAPDAYEINQSTIVIRYLVRNKVAFRLNRLGVDKPHVVTGVVVAAGKS